VAWKRATKSKSREEKNVAEWKNTLEICDKNRPQKNFTWSFKTFIIIIFVLNLMMFMPQ
jgi:hypothetical protein